MDRKMSRNVQKTRSSNRQNAPSEDRCAGSALKGIEARRPPLPGARWPSRRLPEAEWATHSLAPGKRGWPPTSNHLCGTRLCGTRHLPSALPDSEFGDPELGPLGMRHMLRNATFFGFFENLGNHDFDASY